MKVHGVSPPGPVGAGGERVGDGEAALWQLLVLYVLISETLASSALLIAMAFEIQTVAAMADSRTLEATIDQLMNLVDGVLDSALPPECCPV